MSTILIDICNEVRDYLSGLTLSQGFTAERVWVPLVTQITAEAGYLVYVAPTEREITPGTRGPDANEHEIKIGVFRKVGGTESQQNSAIDEAFILSQEVGEALSKQAFTIDSQESSVLSVKFEPAFDEALLKEDRIFAAMNKVTIGDIR